MIRIRGYFPAALLLIICCVALYFILPVYAKHRQTRTDVQQLQESFERQKTEIQQLRAELHALRTDYRAIERVAREKFGLCQGDERIYHFDAQPLPAAPAAGRD